MIRGSGDQAASGPRTGSQPRDQQRARLYDAEEGVDAGRVFVSLDDTQAFVDSITTSAFWERIPNAPRVIRVRDGRGRRHACAADAWFGAELRLPRWSRNQLIVLHELAHTITPSHCASHGPEFAGAYLHLVRRFLSEEHYDALHESFRRADVQVSPQ
ncbi:MAG: hypothetical protein AAF581_19345 [Planctomycetota bacterium]